MSQDNPTAQTLSKETIQLSNADMFALIVATYRATFGYLLIFIIVLLAVTFLFTELPSMIGVILAGIFMLWFSWFITKKVLRYRAQQSSSADDE